MASPGPHTTPPLSENNIDEAVAPYFAAVYVEMVSVVQGFALYTLISQNVIQVPAWVQWDWAYFLRGLTVFLLAMALWHRYVTQLAYVATLHWLHTLFPFLFGVLQFMLANPRVLKPSADGHNLSYFILLMALTALTGVLAYANAWAQHRRNRTKIRFALNFGADAERLYKFWGSLHNFFACFTLTGFLLFLVLAAVANWWYKSWQEIWFPLGTTLFAALSVCIDVRFCAKHRYTPDAVRAIYRRIYGTGLKMNGWAQE